MSYGDLNNPIFNDYITGEPLTLETEHIIKPLPPPSTRREPKPPLTQFSNHNKKSPLDEVYAARWNKPQILEGIPIVNKHRLNTGGGFKKTNRRKSSRRKSLKRKSNRRKSTKRKKSSKRLSRKRR